MKRPEFTFSASNVFSYSLPVAAPFPDKGKTFFLGRWGRGQGAATRTVVIVVFGCFMKLPDMNPAAALMRVELIKEFQYK